jgi:hypothetical protein
MKHPRVLGVSIQFQNRLMEYSPRLYEKLAADAAVRRTFYVFVRQQPSTSDAFNQRYVMFKGAQAVVERQDRSRQRKKDQLKEDKLSKAQQRHEMGVNIALDICSKEPHLKLEVLAAATRRTWVKKFPERRTGIRPLSAQRIQRVVLPQLAELLKKINK